MNLFKKRVLPIFLLVKLTGVLAGNNKEFFHNNIHSLFKHIGISLIKHMTFTYWNAFLSARGLITREIEADARRSGACSIPWPCYQKIPVPIAPTTVPDEIQERIQALQKCQYTWNSCKPLLLIGAAGMGKTQLGRYIAQQTNCPLIYASAAGFMSGKENAGAETVHLLFKRSRIYPEWATWRLRFMHLWNWMFHRPIQHRKPTILLIDEFDAIARPAGLDRLEGDKTLEVEREKALDRLYWELAHNRHTQARIPSLRCPPVTLNERLQSIIGRFFSQYAHNKHRSNELYLARHIAAWPRLWQWRNGYFNNVTNEAILVATTNIPVDQLDPRTKEHFQIIEIKPYNTAQRRAIIEFHARSKQCTVPDWIDQLTARTKNFSADKLESIINQAALHASCREDKQLITQDDLEYSLSRLMSPFQ